MIFIFWACHRRTTIVYNFKFIWAPLSRFTLQSFLKEICLHYRFGESFKKRIFAAIAHADIIQI
jgi:hypothetical protein